MNQVTLLKCLNPKCNEVWSYGWENIVELLAFLNVGKSVGLPISNENRFDKVRCARCKGIFNIRREVL